MAKLTEQDKWSEPRKVALGVLSDAKTCNATWYDQMRSAVVRSFDAIAASGHLVADAERQRLVEAVAEAALKYRAQQASFDGLAFNASGADPFWAALKALTDYDARKAAEAKEKQSAIAYKPVWDARAAALVWGDLAEKVEALAAIAKAQRAAAEEEKQSAARAASARPKWTLVGLHNGVGLRIGWNLTRTVGDDESVFPIYNVTESEARAAMRAIAAERGEVAE